MSGTPRASQPRRGSGTAVGKVVVYTRTSSKKNDAKLNASKARQLATCRTWALKLAKGGKVSSVSETCSGMLPLERRPEFRRLVEGHTPAMKILVESARAVARSALVAESIYRQSVASGVEIIPADLPALLKHQPSPGEALMRKVMFAVTEFQRDVAVTNMANGLLEKKKRLLAEGGYPQTQSGTVKVVGTKTVLQRVPPDGTQRRKLKSLAKKWQAGALGLRPLATSMSTVLKLQKNMSHETARRNALMVLQQ